MKKVTKTVEYQLQTKNGSPWSANIKNKRAAIRWRNRTWPQIDVIKVTTIVEVVDEGKVTVK